MYLKKVKVEVSGDDKNNCKKIQGIEVGREWRVEGQKGIDDRPRVYSHSQLFSLSSPLPFLLHAPLTLPAHNLFSPYFCPPPPTFLHSLAPCTLLPHLRNPVKQVLSKTRLQTRTESGCNSADEPMHGTLRMQTGNILVQIGHMYCSAMTTAAHMSVVETERLNSTGLGVAKSP